MIIVELRNRAAHFGVMFTGLVEECGRVEEFTPGERAWRLRVRARRVAQGWELGESIAVNGCCLTAVDCVDGVFAFDLLNETVRLTSFSKLRPGAAVNLERSLLPTTRMGGHFVSGHVDAVGEITALEKRGADTYLAVRPPAEFMKYLVHKGSIAMDGISLTVAEVTDTVFAVWLIPHTLEVTNLHEKQSGDPVNLEFDLIAKYVERLASVRTGA